jgi:hypothetical protein
LDDHEEEEEEEEEEVAPSSGSLRAGKGARRGLKEVHDL